AYDVAWSDDREADENGKLPAVAMRRLEPKTSLLHDRSLCIRPSPCPFRKTIRNNGDSGWPIQWLSATRSPGFRTRAISLNMLSGLPISIQNSDLAASPVKKALKLPRKRGSPKKPAKHLHRREITRVFYTASAHGFQSRQRARMPVLGEHRLDSLSNKLH
ncbi:MAG: hypothetical protein PVI41_10355, partial [Roseobacter sp.]